jgi:hypothetical protein
VHRLQAAASASDFWHNEQRLGADAVVLYNLSKELRSLSAYWIATVPDSETKCTKIENRSFELSLLVHLMSRAEAVESGIRLAFAIGGYLTISRSANGRSDGTVIQFVPEPSACP